MLFGRCSTSPNCLQQMYHAEIIVVKFFIRERVRVSPNCVGKIVIKTTPFPIFTACFFMSTFQSRFLVSAPACCKVMPKNEVPNCKKKESSRLEVEKIKLFTILAVLRQSVQRVCWANLRIIASEQHSSFRINAAVVASRWQH